MKHDPIHLKDQLNKIAVWLYSNLSTNIPLYERLFNDILFKFTQGIGVSGKVHISIIANNSVDVHIISDVSRSSFSNKRVVNLLYFRDPSFVTSNQLTGDYCYVDNLYESLLLKDESEAYNTICNYSWVLSQSREYKLDVILT